MAFDHLSPATAHNTLGDVDSIRNNVNALRNFEASLSTNPPGNPVADQFWWAILSTDTTQGTMYQRSRDNTAWEYKWSTADPPAKTSDVTNHVNTNITNAIAAHGIRQGAGNGLDADKLDGYDASAFLQTSHNTASSGVHGCGSNVLLSAPVTTPFLVIASTAPLGWTQVTTWNDRALRIVSGTGAATGGSWTIGGITIANHTHSIANDGGHSHSIPAGGSFGWYAPGIDASSTTSSAAAHNHTGGTGTAALPISSDGTWRPSYLDCIAVTKNA